MSSGKAIKPPARRIQNVFVLLLLAVFAGSAVFLTALGAQVYRDTVQVSENNNSSRVLAAIVRVTAQSEDSGRVKIEKLNDEGLLSLTFVDDYGDGDVYLTRLFCADGYLRQSFASADMEFSTDMGDTLCEAASFVPELNGNLLTATVTGTDGRIQVINVSLRAGGITE